jgi:hypothetical protein
LGGRQREKDEKGRRREGRREVGENEREGGCGREEGRKSEGEKLAELGRSIPIISVQVNAYLMFCIVQITYASFRNQLI